MVRALPDEFVQAQLARGDFRRWIADVFGDGELAGTIGRLEQPDTSNAREALLRIVADRYGDPCEI
jgi:hypothetical protein